MAAAIGAFYLCLWKLREPPLFAPFRAVDKLLFKLGRAPRQQIRISEGRVETARPLAFGARLAQRFFS